MYSTKRTGCRLMAAVMVLMLTLMLSVTALAAYPTHEEFISDPDNILSDSTTAAILSANDTLYRNKEVKIAVCLTDSTGGEAIKDFSRTLFSKWEMCDGVLLVLDTSAQTYFAVQSVDIDDILTNTVLQDILAENMEEEFSAGNIDRGVMKTVTALSQFMSANLPAPEGAEIPVETTEDGEPAEEENEPNGFVKFMRVVLWLILIAVILGVGVFVLAMFNDDVGDFVRTYIFRKNSPQPSYHNDYYDDRLYGSQNQGRRNPQNPYNPYGRNGQYGRQGQIPPPQQRQSRQDVYDPYNDYDMQYQQSRQPQPRQPQGQYRQNGQRPPQQGYPKQGYGGQGYNQYPGGNGYGQHPRQGQRRPNPNNRGRNY